MNQKGSYIQSSKMHMIIGIDGNEANVEKRVGVNTYAYEIIKNLKKLQADRNSSFDLIVYLKKKPVSDMPEETANFKYKVLSGGGYWVITKLLPHLVFSNAAPDIFFTPSHYLPPMAGMPMVCSIMDLGYLDFSDQFPKKVFWQLKWWTATSILVSNRIISISNSTARDIVRHYPFAKDKIEVVPLAYDPDKFNPNINVKDVRRIKNKYSIVDDYILYIGTLKPSKNIDGLIEAFSLLKRNYNETAKKVKLVVAGKKGWFYENIFDKAKSLGLRDEIIFTDYVDEIDKPPLIAGAKVLAIPSFWEGFGLDALNAMAAGTPVVASRTGSLPEVVENAGILVDPYSVESISSGLKQVLSMTKTEYNMLVRKGLEAAKRFSWQKTALATYKIFEDVYRQNRKTANQP